MIVVDIPGEAIPGGSKRWVGRVIDANPRSGDWRRWCGACGLEAHGCGPLEGALAVCFGFTLRRPKSVRKRVWPHVRPDLTKLVRSTEDGLTGVLWVDDAQVVEQCAWKRYEGYEVGALWRGEGVFAEGVGVRVLVERL